MTAEYGKTKIKSFGNNKQIEPTKVSEHET